eukprot:s2786_g6.t1
MLCNSAQSGSAKLLQLAKSFATSLNPSLDALGLHGHWSAANEPSRQNLLKQGHIGDEHKSWLKVSNLRPVSVFMFSGSSACRTRTSEDHRLKY